MDSTIETFITRIRQGPVVLLLGQGYLAIETGVDPFLREIIRKYGPALESPPSYGDMLEGEASTLEASALAWMDERCRRLPAPDWLGLVSSYPWSAVYTSAIDSIWFPGFRNVWRELQPIFDERFRPPDPRNRLMLHCTFLYGCVNRTEENERPPLSRSEWRRRRLVPSG